MMPLHGDVKYSVGLVQINNSFANACYLPYTAGLLQSYFQHYSKRAEEFTFLKPIYRRIKLEDAVNHLKGADIVGLSVSSWNFRVSLEIAKSYKQINPEALIVVGGPHVPRDALSLLTTYPWVDIVCHGEGEIVFKLILEAWPDRQWDEIPSISYLKGGKYVSRSEEYRITDLDTVPSPYNTGVFDSLMKDDQGHQWLALWETNRGCPFSCTYCDWGASTRSKIFCFGMERLKKEIEWFAKNHIEFIFCCDSNFGILPRDMEIVKAVAEMKRMTGFPKALSVQNTKDADRSYKIQKALADEGLSKGVNLALQSMNRETLALIGRKNISPEIFKDLQQRYNRDGIETFSDIIIGLPGETYDSFTAGIEQIINHGQHNRIQFINLSVLPNAPMANPEYMKKHGLITVESKIVNIHGLLTEHGDGIYETQSLVVGSSTMPLMDWQRSRVFAWMTSLLYFDKILQIPIMLLHAVKGISYVEQIESFLNLPDDRFPIFEELNKFFYDEAKRIQEGGSEFFYSPDILGIYWPHDEYAYIRLSIDNKLKLLYKEAHELLSELLVKKGYENPSWLSEAINLNQELLKQPFHTEDVDFKTDYTILEACESIRKNGHGTIDHLPVCYRIIRTKEKWSNWLDWCREVVWYGNKRGAYLYPYKIINQNE